MGAAENRWDEAEALGMVLVLWYLYGLALMFKYASWGWILLGLLLPPAPLVYAIYHWV